MRPIKYSKKYPPIIAIDFDGTISNKTFGKFNYKYRTLGVGYMTIEQEWIDIIKRLHNRGAELILYTCREGYYLKMATDVLNANGILDCFVAINENSQKQLIRFDACEQPRKPIADFYLDDLAGLGVKRDDLLFYLRKIYFTDYYLNHKQK